MATAVTWLYTIHLKNTPEYRHMIRGSSFSFSDIRHIIAKVALNDDFDILSPTPIKPVKKIYPQMPYCARMEIVNLKLLNKNLKYYG